MCTFISVNMLLWRPSTSVPSMLWLQFKWQINRYVNGYLLCSKGTRCSLCMLHDCILKPLDPQIPWLGGFLCGLSEKTTENTNTGGRHVKSRWMDVVRTEVRSADVQIKDEAVPVPSFPLEAAGWPRVQGAQTNECVEEVRITPPLPLLMRLFHSSAFIFICACIWTIISCMRLNYTGREKRNESG